MHPYIRNLVALFLALCSATAVTQFSSDTLIESNDEKINLISRKDYPAMHSRVTTVKAIGEKGGVSPRHKV